MTFEQARKEYPSVPERVVRWAVDNIPNERQVRRGLYQLQVGMNPMEEIEPIEEVAAAGGR
ncbi:MAG: hypothetical protein C4521_00540 [Actinobacteria bacterium]|nr:MAG: hypothetical protein C4521_00540 [Actinomycetota bacterium]